MKIIYSLVIRLLPEEKPTEEEIEAIRKADEDTSDLIPHDAIAWD